MNRFPQMSRYTGDQHSHLRHGKCRFKPLPQPGSEQGCCNSQLGRSLGDSPVYLTTVTLVCISLPIRLVPVRNSCNLVHSPRKN